MLLTPLMPLAILPGLGGAVGGGALDADVWLLEDGTSGWLMEDGSSFFLLEA